MGSDVVGVLTISVAVEAHIPLLRVYLSSSCRVTRLPRSRDTRVFTTGTLVFVSVFAVLTFAGFAFVFVRLTDVARCSFVYRLVAA